MLAGKDQETGDRQAHSDTYPRPRDGLGDLRRSEGYWDADESEHEHEACRDDAAHVEALQDCGGCARQPLLVGADVEGEQRGQEREPAGVDAGKPAGYESETD